jgi:DNA-binding LacI/PurR family transcriptional regulator
MTRLRKKVTIRDVAAAAGVSHQTVSRVINERPDVAEQTRHQVRQVIKDLGYQPSAIARSLIRQRSFTLGVVTAGLGFFGPARVLNGIIEKAEEMGFTLLLKELPSFDAKDIEPLLNSLLARQVDGIVWGVPEVGTNRDWLRDRLPELPAPLILITTKARPDLPVSTVSVDNYAGGRLATQHLLEQGYEHIGHITGPLDWWEARQRKAGWQDALREAGVQVADHHWEEGDWSPTGGEQALHRLLGGYPEMDALFAANDQMALGVLQAMRREGLNVPQDIALVGFDDIPESAHFSPPLTTVYQDLPELGNTAVLELVQTIEASQQGEAVVGPVTILLQPELIVRESSAATN